MVKNKIHHIQNIHSWCTRIALHSRLAFQDRMRSALGAYFPSWSHPCLKEIATYVAKLTYNDSECTASSRTQPGNCDHSHPIHSTWSRVALASNEDSIQSVKEKKYLHITWRYVRESKCILDWISINGRLCPRNVSRVSGSCSNCEWELRSYIWVEKG